MAKQNENAYLVTGNSKHFPKKPFIVTANELLDIMKWCLLLWIICENVKKFWTVYFINTGNASITNYKLKLLMRCYVYYFDVVLIHRLSIIQIRIDYWQNARNNGKHQKYPHILKWRCCNQNNSPDHHTFSSEPMGMIPVFRIA